MATPVLLHASGRREAARGFDLAAVATTIIDWSSAAKAWAEPATKLVVRRGG